MKLMGENLFEFEPFWVFGDEYKALYPELYNQFLEEESRSSSTGHFASELDRLKQIMRGEA